MGGVHVRVASLADLIMAKQCSDRPKDRLHLRLLLQVQEECVAVTTITTE